MLGYVNLGFSQQRFMDSAPTEKSPGNHAWLHESTDKIAQMFVAAGYLLPEQHPETGAYMFLLHAAAVMAFSTSSSPDLSSEAEAAQLKDLLSKAFLELSLYATSKS